MEIPSISKIKGLRDTLRKKISEANRNQFGDQRFGPENEYTYKELLSEIDSLLSEISSLVRAPRKFVRSSTKNDRDQILAQLTNINNQFGSQPGNYVNHVEALKIYVRLFRPFFQKEKVAELEETIQALLEQKREFIESVREIQAFRESAETINEQFKEKKDALDSSLQSLQNQSLELGQKLASTEEANLKVNKVKDIAEERLREVQASFNEVKSNEKIVNSFAQKVQDREKRLEAVENETTNYRSTLEKFETERNLLLKEAEELISTAREALEYKTAEGISASFQEQYNEAKNSGKGWWLFGAAASLTITIALGVWVVFEEHASLTLILGRIALLPFPIIGAIFCANQYVKSKNIQEDYAYKMVLAKAMVGFSEQIKEHGSANNEEYLHYMKKVLDEIHLDPLRKRDVKFPQPQKESPEVVSLDKAIELLEKAVKLKNM